MSENKVLYGLNLPEERQRFSNISDCCYGRGTSGQVVDMDVSRSGGHVSNVVPEIHAFIPTRGDAKNIAGYGILLPCANT